MPELLSVLLLRSPSHALHMQAVSATLEHLELRYGQMMDPMSATGPCTAKTFHDA